MGNKEMSPIISNMVFYPFGPGRKWKLWFSWHFQSEKDYYWMQSRAWNEMGPFLYFFFVLLSNPRIQEEQNFRNARHCIALRRHRPCQDTVGELGMVLGGWGLFSACFESFFFGDRERSELCPPPLERRLWVPKTRCWWCHPAPVCVFVLYL